MGTLIAMSETHHRAPSEILKIDDPYTAWCIDEAAVYISAQIKRHKKPKWRKEQRRQAGGNAEIISRLLISGMATSE